MATVWAVANGNWNTGATWNTGSVPTSADDVFTNGFTVNMDVNATVNSLNNSARARDIATPAMTANNAPSPYVAAASSVQSGSDAFQAFNRVTSGGSYWQAANNATGWISMDFGASIIIDAYTIFGSDNQTPNPRNWTFEGSANNTTWTTLHTVTLGAGIAANSSYSSGSISNPTAYRYYRVNVTLNGGSVNNLRISELELYQPGTAALAAGGSFNFNTAGVSVTCTSNSASLSAGATNLITVTATTGTVTLNLGSSVTSGLGTSTQIFNYTGACNLILSGIEFRGSITGTFGARCINKASSGTITVNGSLGGGSGNSSQEALLNTNGNVIINGNVSANNSSSATLNNIGGDVTINGNVTGGINGGAIASSNGTLTVTGRIVGQNSIALILSNPTTSITGDVIAGNVAAISSTTANTINVIGDVYASATANGISSTNANGVVNLTGNMYNGLGRNAIYCQNVFISNTATTLWRMDTGGGDYKFLYSADSTPNLPATSNVRSGVTFGPALSLTGTMVVPTAANVRKDVPVDNTVGTGELTSADIISGINASSDSLAVRLKNILTDKSAGNIISQYKDA